MIKQITNPITIWNKLPLTSYKLPATSYQLLVTICCVIFAVLTSCSNNSGTFQSNTDTLIYNQKEVFAGDTLKTYARISYPYFLDEDENTGINTFLLLQFTKGTKNNSFQEVCEHFVKQNDSIVVDTFESTKNWVKDHSIKVEYQYYPIISLSNNWYEFTGGAHGNHGTNFINYNCKSHSEITLKDLFNSEQIKQLTKIAEQIFRKNEGLKPSEDYSNYFFENGVFVLPENFSIQKDGLLFQYSIYEIKPYVEGTTDLFVPYESIRGLIDKGNVLGSLYYVESINSTKYKE